MRRPVLMAAMFFLGGLVLGVFVTSHVWITTSRFLLESVAANFQNEQFVRASQAKRHGDLFRYVVHSVNAADAQAEIGFLWSRRTLARGYWSWFELPWSSYPLIWDLEPIASTAKGLEGARRSEATYRSSAALALEEFGRPDLAATQWERATELVPTSSREKLRTLAMGSIATLGEAYERAYLESTTQEEFTAALDEIRKTATLTDP